MTTETTSLPKACSSCGVKWAEEGRPLCAKCDPEPTAAKALTDAQQAAANLFGELADDGDLLALLRKNGHGGTAADVQKTVKAWRAAGETWLRSLGGGR